METKSGKRKKFSSRKRALIAIILIFSIFFSPVTTPKADAWASIMAAFIRTVLQKLVDTIEDIIVAVLKQVGSQVVTKLATRMVSGDTGGPMFITDWEDYIFGSAKKKSQGIMNDYISQLTRGTGSSSGYQPASGFEGIGPKAFNQGIGQYGNYASQVTEILKGGVVAQAAPKMTFEGNPATVYAGGNFKKDSILRSGVNTPLAAEILVAKEAEKQIDKQAIVAQTKAIATQGIPGKEKNGLTVTPGALIKDKLSSVLSIPDQSLATAKTIGQVLTALATKFVSETIGQGLGNIEARIQKEIGGPNSKANVQIKAQINTSGPGAYYNKK